MDTGKEGKDMTIQNLRKMNELKRKSSSRKNNPNLRHTPNEKDKAIVLENAKIMQSVQYETLQNK